MKCLGMDLGTKTLGLAISDKQGIIASPYKLIRFKAIEDAVKEVIDITQKEKIEVLVLGLPKNMNNTLGQRASITLEFKNKLEKELGIEVIMEDERLTSVISNNVLIQASMSRKKRKKKVDGMASVIILQSYLDRKVK